MDDVNWSGAAVCAASALPPRNVLLTPKGTSCEEKLKFPWVVLTSNVTAPAVAATVTMMPFSCIGPVVADGAGGLVRAASFQLEVPVMESALSNRQPCRLRIVAPVAVIEPSQLVSTLSPTPRITRKD